MRCQHAHGMEEQQEKWLLQPGWYFLHEKHLSFLTAKLLCLASKSVFYIQRRGKNCLCENLCSHLHPTLSTCVCLNIQTDIPPQAFVLGYMSTCSPWVCKPPSVVLCIHVIAPAHNHIQRSLLLNSGNRHFSF